MLFFKNKFIVLFSIAISIPISLFGTQTPDSNPRILLIEPWNWTKPGGLGINNLYQSEYFNRNGIYFLTLFWEGSYSENLNKQKNLPYDVFPKSLQKDLSLSDTDFAYRLSIGWLPFPDHLLQREIKRICLKHNINILITPKWEDLNALKAVAKELGVKLIFARHASIEQDFIKLKYDVNLLTNIDGFAGGNEEITQFVKSHKDQNKINIKHFAAITPFWDQEKCLNFVNQETRADYFKRKFNITLDEAPVVCTIANLLDPCKNHPLLFNALAHLINNDSLYFHIMVAGSGPLQSNLEKLASELKIDKYVHFLGLVNDVPELLYHCDAHVLPSYHESFSLANLEAACMKKPIIMARGLSASRVIPEHNKELLFENNDFHDLANTIKSLFSNKKNIIAYGQNMYQFVMDNYSNEVIFQQWEIFIKNILKQS